MRLRKEGARGKERGREGGRGGGREYTWAANQYSETIVIAVPAVDATPANVVKLHTRTNYQMVQASSYQALTGEGQARETDGETERQRHRETERQRDRARQERRDSAHFG